MRSKITIVGAGNVGATCAQRLFERDYADIVLMDVIEGMPQGKALDLLQSSSITTSDSLLTGTNNYEEILHEYIKQRWGISSTKELTRQQAKEAIDYLKKEQYLQGIEIMNQSLKN